LSERRGSHKGEDEGQDDEEDLKMKKWMIARLKYYVHKPHSLFIICHVN